MRDEGLELRCTCRARPLLAVARVTSDAAMFLHIRVYKRGDFYAEIIVEDGPVRIRCRNCLRWFTVRIRKGAVDQKQEQLPARIVVPPLLRERNKGSLVASSDS